MLKLKNSQNIKFDILSFGEVMLRFDPKEFRINCARNFNVCEGGGEYNVSRNLAKCFGKKSAVVTSFVKNEIGALLKDLILQGGVDCDYIKWIDFDGIGRSARNSINFVERGFGIRAAKSCSDRFNSAMSKLKTEDIDWKKIFSDGIRWFHTGGICVALSKDMKNIILDAIKEAKKTETIVSYDLNYRESLWKNMGGKKNSIKINREIVKQVDVLFGNEEDFTSCLGLNSKTDEDYENFDIDSYKKVINNLLTEFPNLKAVGITLRKAKTATTNGWTGLLYYDNQIYQGKNFDNLEIFDRVGAGDSFVAGVIYGFLENLPHQETVDIGVISGALAMTTPGDTSMATFSDIKNILENSSYRIKR